VLGLRRINLLRPPALDVREPAVGERDLLRVRLRVRVRVERVSFRVRVVVRESGAEASVLVASRFFLISKKTMFAYSGPSREIPKKKKVVCLQMRHRDWDRGLAVAGRTSCSERSGTTCTVVITGLRSM